VTVTSSAFAGLPLTARNHFRVSYHAAVFHLVAAIHASRDSGDLALHAVLARHPFLQGYVSAMTPSLPDDLAWEDAPGWWRRELRRWEDGAVDHLPLVAIEQLGAGVGGRLAVLVAGLVDEDPRFGSVFAELQRPAEARRPTLAMLAAVVGDGELEAWSLRSALVPAGLLDADVAAGPGGGRVVPDLDAPVRVPAPLWSVLRGGFDPALAPWLEHVPSDRLVGLGDAVLAGPLRERVGRAQALLRDGARTVVVTGPAASGRRRLAGTLARSLGLGALFIDAAAQDASRPGGLGTVTGTSGATRHRDVGPLAVALRAMPVLRFDARPGEAVEVARPDGYDGPLAVVAHTDAGLRGSALDRAVRLELPRLGPDERRAHWATAFGDTPVDGLDAIADRFVLPEGHLRRLAGEATLVARLDGRESITVDDVAGAKRTLNRQRLDGLAHRLEPLAGWSRLVVDEATRRLLAALEARCRRRERLLGHLGDAFSGSGNVGVRVLFGGASGTGKTLAARILAAELGTDVYRVDLAAIVDKYVGETEKNLHRVLAGAEELDVVLLIDEGDSLLGNRTEVRSANDRFANLETNYLLQRLEHHQGIVVVTTNAADRIDPAFQRRMDAVLQFREPGPAERREIWRLHLPDEHEVSARHLDELAGRAELTGGQIRNAAMQAALFALDAGVPLASCHLDEAVATEYGKAGAVSPFQRTAEVRRLRRPDAFLDALS
jgi:DNA polymerase III delta prime subunit